MLTLLSPIASAFCGVYLSSTGDALYNNTSQVVIGADPGLRDGQGQVTLTLASDISGDASDFALVIPVPAVLTDDDVRTVDPQLLTGLTAFSAPRLVQYTCDTLYGWGDSGWGGGGRSSGCGCFGGHKANDTGGWSDTGSAEDDYYGSVEVETSFTTGVYDIVVLSAEESADLLRWLNDHGYQVDDKASSALQEYIDAGQYFLAARISLDTAPSSGEAWLEPLQLSWAGTDLTLPVRLGTVNAQDEQSVLLHVVGESRAAIANYPEVTLEDECMWNDAQHGDLNAFQVSQLASAFADEDAAWLTEYAWTDACDPCTESGDFNSSVAAEFGYQGSSVAFLTRLYVRYQPEALGADLGVYLTGLTDMTQLKYVLYRHELESEYPVCQSGWADDPGTCLDEAAAVPLPHDHRGAFAMLFALAGGLWWRRRKSELFGAQRRRISM